MEKEIIKKIKEASKIVITAHKSPDGDAIGSTVALYHFCKKLGKEAYVCLPDTIPSFLNWLEGAEIVHYFDKAPETVANLLTSCDLLFSLDYNEINRVGTEMGAFLESSTAYKIMIDHHTFPESYANITYSFPDVCSTCQLIYDVIDKGGEKALIDEKIGTAIYLGIMTDTGSFRFPSVTPHTHEIAMELMKVGVKHYRVHEQVYDSNTVDRIRLRGYALSNKLEIFHDGQIALITLTKEELAKFNYKKGDTEGLVNEALSVIGVKIAAFFSEKEGIIRISFRSKGTNNKVNLLSQQFFNGGGHINAAGGSFNGGMLEAVQLFKKEVYAFLDKD